MSAVDDGLKFIDGLDRDDRSAFLALFAGARRDLTSFDGECPAFGKAECEWVLDWEIFYGKRLVEAGLVEFTAGESKPALGGPPGMMYRDITIAPTHVGYEVRHAWWERNETASLAWLANQEGAK